MNDTIYKLLNQTKNVEDLSESPLSDMEVTNLMKQFHHENNPERSQKITHKNHRIIAGVASVAMVAVLIPTSVYAYARFSAFIQKTAPYQNTVRIDFVTDEHIPDSVPVSEGYMTWHLGYLPEGYVLDKDGFKYHNAVDGSGITPCFYRIPETMDNFEVDLRYSATCENYASNGNTAMINYRIDYNEQDNDPKVFGREVWIYFGETRYVLQLFIGNGVSQDELYKIIDNASLVPANEKTYSEHFDWLEKPEKNGGVYVNSVADSIPLDDCNRIRIGETGTYQMPDDHKNCSFRINHAEIINSFNGIHTDSCGWYADYSEYADENGTVLPNTRTWYKLGDGVDTRNEDIYAYEMPFHILKLTVTATNDTDQYQEFCICPELIYFTSDSVPIPFEVDENVPKGYEDLKYTTYGFSKPEISFRDSLFDRTNKRKFLSSSEFFSFSTDDAHMGKKNYVNLDVGESADFEVCFMISDNSIGNIYLQFYRIGNTDRQSLRDGYPLFDLTEIRIK